jgi:hypothetical protein
MTGPGVANGITLSMLVSAMIASSITELSFDEPVT